MNDLETTKLFECETIIERGLKTFVDVGGALLEIRDLKLYRANYGTFEDYCQNRWGMSRPRAYQLIEAAETLSNLSTIVDILPATESQARPLTQLEPEQQLEAWNRVLDTAPDTGITAAHVQAVVDEIQNKPHVSYNSGENEWYTPSKFIESARLVMGSID